MSDDEETYDYEGTYTCVHATEKAIKVARQGFFHPEFWVPQWAVHEDSEVYAKGHTGKLIVKLRWAEDQGLL